MEVYMGFWNVFLAGCSFTHRIKDIKNIGEAEALMCMKYETTYIAELEILIHSANIYSIPALCQALC